MSVENDIPNLFDENDSPYHILPSPVDEDLQHQRVTSREKLTGKSTERIMHRTTVVLCIHRVAEYLNRSSMAGGNEWPSLRESTRHMIDGMIPYHQQSHDLVQRLPRHMLLAQERSMWKYVQES